jgi:ribosomal protein S18 acetylase RimI-like enzyme
MPARPFVLHLQRELEGPVEAPIWPVGVACRTLIMNDRKAADSRAVHAVLQGGYWEGGSGAATYREWWSQVRRDPEFDPELCFLAVDEGGVVAVAHCWSSAFVKDLAVLPRARRKGIGRALMLHAFATFKAKGFARITLKTREENLIAMRLYESLGMCVIGRLPG